ncbi:MAG: Rieske 2Fe-2S domain-containing protein [Hyphomicrobiaceae bacterium]
MNEHATFPARNGQRIANGMLEDNYPRNMWWVAAMADEVTDKPLAKWLLELPIVLFRLQDGTPVALDDRCPHRWAPLSDGRVVDDQIVCPYHGMAFGKDGACTHVPTQGTIPSTARVQSYPLVESGAFIWIWMGDKEEIENSPPPVDMSYTTNPDWSVVTGYYEVATNWVLIRENVLDLTHIAHLHTNTFKQDDWNSVPDVAMEGDVVIYRQEFDLAPLSPLFCHAMGLSETKPIKRVQEGRMESLAVSFSDWNVHDPEPTAGARSDFLMRGCHIVTPAQRGTTHYYWGAAFDIADVPADICEKTKASVIAAFDEDKGLLERMQTMIGADARRLDYPEVTLAADGAGVRVRQVLQRKLAAEGRKLS